MGLLRHDRPATDPLNNNNNNGIFRGLDKAATLYSYFILTPQRTAYSEKLTVSQRIQKFPELYETRKFITVHQERVAFLRPDTC